MASKCVVPSFLGFDFSTQQVKTIATDEHLQIVYENSVKFDTDLPEFRTEGGVHMHDDKRTVTAPTIMWVKALDMLLYKMKSDGFNFSSLKALSGAGQQHGSVFWKKGAHEVLAAAHSTQPLHEQLKGQFSVEDSPIWMDSSTTEQCRQLEGALGGPQELARLTGARAYERFTGPQIAKIYQKQPEAYANTERISLVSSFAACLFLGDYAAIDLADGSGMNLLDINTRQWSQQCMNVCAPDLKKKTGESAVPSHTVLGSVSAYLVDRYGFSPDCQVVAFTGDNPASMAGMKLQKGEVMVSLGTSDTLVLWLSQAHPDAGSFLSINCLDPRSYMAMLVYKNGSLTREAVKDRCCNGSWKTFEDHINDTSPGNDGQIGIYFDVQEIIPHAVGVYRFDASGQQVSAFGPASEARAVIEGQFLAKRLHAEKLGYEIGSGCRLLATGGASSNKAILQVLADVFGTEVYTLDVPNSACLGSAYRAKHGYLGDKTSFSEIVSATAEFHCAARPKAQAKQIYDEMLCKYKDAEAKVLQMQ